MLITAIPKAYKAVNEQRMGRHAHPSEGSLSAKLVLLKWVQAFSVLTVSS